MSVTAAGYVGAAVIAATATFLGVVVGKEQKTTGFRQDWINAQREDLALMLACALNARALCAEKRGEAMTRFDEAHGRVKLRENPEKQEWKYVLEELERLRSSAFVDQWQIDLTQYQTRIVELSQRLLKAEWTRVRAGETWFRAAKCLLPPTVLVVGLALAYGKGFIQIL